MRLGGFSPLPTPCGGGESTLQVVYESLNGSLGTAYDTSDTSTVTAETMSEARAIDAAWSANRRLSYQTDPTRMTDMLSRWERILFIAPTPGDSYAARRSRVAVKFRALVGALYATVEAACTALLGSALVGVEYTDDAHAHSQWPGSAPVDVNGWNSTLGYFLIRVDRAYLADAATFSAIGDLMSYLGDALPSFTRFAWGAYNSTGAIGFLLDETRNLDVETFDS